MQEWKKSSSLFKDFRKFEAVAPPAPNVNLTEFPMKFVQVSRNDQVQGPTQFSFSLPNNVRLLYSKDPVHSEDWKNLILDFDSKPLG